MAGILVSRICQPVYLHNLIFGDTSPINPVTWSLEVEIQFYLLAPLVMQIFRIESRTIRRGVLIAGVLALGLLQIPFLHNPRFILSIGYQLQYFLIGLLLADIFVLDLKDIRSSWMWDVAALAGLCVMYGWHRDQYAAHVLLPFALGTICLAAMRSLVLRRFVAQPWIAVIGGMCYSIYLMHFMLLAAIFKISQRLIVARADFLTNYLIQCVVAGIPIFFLSFLFYMLVERPCMDPDWPSHLWHRVTGRNESEMKVLDAAISLSDSSPTPLFAEWYFCKEETGKIIRLSFPDTIVRTGIYLEELFWRNATVFCLQVSLSLRGIPIRLPIRFPMRFSMPAWSRTHLAV